MSIFNRKTIILIALVALAAILAVILFVFKKTDTGPSVQSLILPEGFKIETYANKLNGPRVIEFDSRGRMVVSQTKAGNVIIIEDKNGDGLIKDDEKSILLNNLKSPHGLAFYIDKTTNKTYLYVAETNQVNRYVYDVIQGKIVDKGENILKLPDDGEHFTRTIAFGPNFRKEPILSGNKSINTLTDIKLYVSVGSSCDVCVEDTWKRAVIMESDPEGSYMAEFAGGLRDSEFFTFNPDTKEIWATEIGRDNLGDNLPPDEVNIIKAPDKSDQFGAKRYGWPFCYGDKIKDTSFVPGKYTRVDIFEDCSKTVAPVIEIPAHSAPLGLVFVPSAGGWPADWQNSLLVAYHGSSEEGVRQPQIVKFVVDKNGKVSESFDFVTGWLNNDGRPVDLKFGPDKALYVSDDYSGIIYRIVFAN